MYLDLVMIDFKICCFTCPQESIQSRVYSDTKNVISYLISRAKCVPTGNCFKKQLFRGTVTDAVKKASD